MLPGTSGLWVAESTALTSSKLWERRVRTCIRTTELKPHIDILRRLGPGAMSEDEREEVHGTVTYRIKTPRWRNSAVTKFLRVVDRVAAMQKVDLVKDNRGNPVHVRIPGRTRDETKRPVRGLPPSVYDNIWKSNLSEEQIRDLNEDEEDYPFVHSPDLFE